MRGEKTKQFRDAPEAFFVCSWKNLFFSHRDDVVLRVHSVTQTDILVGIRCLRLI